MKRKSYRYGILVYVISPSSIGCLRHRSSVFENVLLIFLSLSSCSFVLVGITKGNPLQVFHLRTSTRTSTSSCLPLSFRWAHRGEQAPKLASEVVLVGRCKEEDREDSVEKRRRDDVERCLSPSW